MKNNEVKRMLPLNLQFFAEDDNNNSSNENNDSSNDNNEDHANHGEKTFTQSEVSRMMAKEKREGKSSVLKSLGFETEEDAKSALNLLKALTDSQKTEEQKANEKKDNAIKDKNNAEKRAEAAEAKLSCVLNGVNKDSIDDVLSIAITKVTDDKSLDDVIADMKKEKRYSSFFGVSNDEANKGTGRNPGHSSKKEGEDNYGAKLAKSTGHKQNKVSYFN